jgi:hypothetical protein
MAALDIIKRFDKDVDGRIVLYKIVSVNQSESGTYLSLRVGIPGNKEKRKEYTFKLTIEELYLLKEFFEKALQNETQKLLENAINKKLVKQQTQQQSNETQQEVEIERIPDDFEF